MNGSSSNKNNANYLSSPNNKISHRKNNESASVFDFKEINKSSIKCRGPKIALGGSG